MTITLPAEQTSFLTRLVKLGRFASRDEAITEALRRLAAEEELGFLNPQPLTPDEADGVYAANPEWEKTECSLAGRAKPEA